MLMIILSHSGAPEEYTWLYNSFFLSAFFFASGYTFKPMLNFGSFITHKIKGQVYPFVVFGMINAVIAVIVEKDSWHDRLQFFISRNGIWDDMWFIACLVSSEMVFYMLFGFVKKCTKGQNKNQLILFVSSLVVSYLGILYIRNVQVKLPWQFEHACSNVVFVALGYLIKQKEEDHPITAKVKQWAIVSGIYVASIFIFPNHVAIHAGEYANWALYFVDAVLGIASLILFSQMIEKYFGDVLITRFITFVGTNTLVYYAFQSKVIKVVQILLIKIGVLSITPYFVSLIVVFMSTMILVIPAWLIRKKAPFLLKMK